MCIYDTFYSNLLYHCNTIHFGKVQNNDVIKSLNMKAFTILPQQPIKIDCQKCRFDCHNKWLFSEYSNGITFQLECV